MSQRIDKRELNIVVLIRSDPRLSRRPVEAIRMALGLGAGVNHVAIILMGNAPLLLTGDEEIQDYDILEKYIASFEDAESPFLVEDGYIENNSGFATNYPYKKVTSKEIARTIEAGDHFLIF